MAEGDAGEQEAPEQGNGDTKDGRQNAVTPVFGDGEGGVAELPHSVQAVCPIRLCYDVLKLHLMGNLKEVLIITNNDRTSLGDKKDFSKSQTRLV